MTDPPADPGADPPAGPGAGADERLAALERRVAALERSGVEPATPPTGDFWALEGLRDRTPEESGRVVFAGTAGTADGRRYEWQETRLVGPLLADDWDAAAAAFAALGHPVRVRLLREVLVGRATTAELVELDTLGTSGQVYHHLRQLTAAGWLRAVSRGRWEVPVERVIPLLVAVAAATR
jgi:DNA-binding transcriptional ArsR family regulator